MINQQPPWRPIRHIGDWVYPLLFGLPFAAQTFTVFLLAFRIYQDHSGNALWTNLSEWLINYEGGFVRRGLIGQALFETALISGQSPTTSLILAIVITFFLLAFISQRLTSRKFPVWALLSPPLLGFLLYTHDVFRKDALLLILFSMCLLLIRSHDGRLLELALLSTLLSAGILIHEVFFFMAYPICIFLLSMKRRDHFVAPPRTSAQSLTTRLLAPALIALPAITFGAILANKGDSDLALKTENSWRLLAGQPIVTQLKPLSQIWWLTKDGAFGHYWTMHFLQLRNYHIPYWLLMVTMMIVAFLSVNALWNKREYSRAFSLLFVLQAFAMAPIMLLGIDSGRWVFLTIYPSFLAASVFGDETLPTSLRVISSKIGRFAFDPRVAPIALLLWSLPMSGWEWGRPSWYSSSLPLSSVSFLKETYLLLRMSGMPRPF